MLNILGSPAEYNLKHSISDQIVQNVTASRQIIRNILERRDPRMLIIVGPCSFHDPIANLEYANKLKQLADKFSERLYIVMRVYPEKSRTALGWKGYINDPHLDNGDQIIEGIVNIRQFMAMLAEINLPIATEILNPIAYLYYEQFLSWGTIGARTVESQIHREIAANLSIPIGFKNNIMGDIDVAINSIKFATRQQTFIGANKSGQIWIINALGNPYSHLVLRGGNNGANYQPKFITYAEQQLGAAQLPVNIIVDCSHGNSGKDYTKQPQIFREVLMQRCSGSRSIIGLMLESFLQPGNQSFDKSGLKYGCSVTDPCLGWDETLELLEWAYQNCVLPEFVLSGI